MIVGAAVAGAATSRQARTVLHMAAMLAPSSVDCAALLGPFAEDVGASLGADAVLLRGHAADADRTDDLAVDDQRDAALEWRHAGEAEDRQPAAGQPVLEGLARPLEARRGARLVLRDLGAGDLGVVHALEVDELAGGVDDRHRHRPSVLLALGERGGRDL